MSAHFDVCPARRADIDALSSTLIRTAHSAAPVCGVSSTPSDWIHSPALFCSRDWRACAIRESRSY
ncbi:hypothetical protein [Nocardia callitridis]|uniref:hypothetical protein n=1 Tax=Nocardia callitridis TaxID=648753 RepID=UPI0031EF330A